MGYITFDPTISLGSLIAGASIIISVIGVAWKFSNRLAVTIAQVESIADTVTCLIEKISKLEVLAARIADNKERMDSLEERLLFVERKK